MAGYVNLSESLSQAITAATKEVVGEIAPAVLASLVARLPQTGNDAQAEMLRFFSFSVWGKGEERVIDGEGPHAVWRWSKRDSPYRKAGSWGRDLGRVLEEGEWSAGRGFVLLAKGVKGREEGVLMDL